MTEAISTFTRRVLNGVPLERAAVEVLAAAKDEALLALLDGARQIRERFFGNQVRCCSIAAAKVGGCGEDCAFCSQSAHYVTHVGQGTELNPEQVFAAAMNAAANGAESFGIVTSGYGPTDAEIDHWGPVIRRIRSTGKLRACACLGVVSRFQARRLAEWGVQRYNLNLQTSARHFPNIVTTHGYQQRLESLYYLKAAGLSLCSGALFGVGESWADRLDLAFELRRLEAEVVPLNFLIPIAGTPLADRPPLGVDECLKIMAVYRFLLPARELKVAGGRESCLGDKQELIFAAGANSFLIGNYLTTCGQTPPEDQAMVRALGLSLARYESGPVPVSFAPAAC